MIIQNYKVKYNEKLFQIWGVEGNFEYSRDMRIHSMKSKLSHFLPNMLMMVIYVMPCLFWVYRDISRCKNSIGILYCPPITQAEVVIENFPNCIMLIGWNRVGLENVLMAIQILCIKEGLVCNKGPKETLR